MLHQRKKHSTKNIHLQHMVLTYNYSNDIIDYEMTARESSGESGSVVLCQSMYIPVETSEPGVTSGLLQLVNEMFFCLFLSHFQNQSISGERVEVIDGPELRDTSL